VLGGLLLAHRRIIEIVGDAPEIFEELKGINYRLTNIQAQKLLTLICLYKRWPKYIVKHTNRKTTSIYAHCISGDKKTITIHNVPTVQLLLHEATHIKYDDHDDKFKKAQVRLIRLYKNKFLKSIFEGDNVNGETKR
jgi:hypothetical protein